MIFTTNLHLYSVPNYTCYPLSSPCAIFQTTIEHNYWSSSYPCILHIHSSNCTYWQGTSTTQAFPLRLDAMMSLAFGRAQQMVDAALKMSTGIWLSSLLNKQRNNPIWYMLVYNLWFLQNLSQKEWNYVNHI